MQPHVLADVSKCYYNPQEIIQNADDAGASTVHFYLDNRRHGTRSLVEPQLARFQGPSLLAYNDAIFQDKDWQSIQDLQQSVKAEDPFKVGKFGIGFNSVYHITGKKTSPVHECVLNVQYNFSVCIVLSSTMCMSTRKCTPLNPFMP